MVFNLDKAATYVLKNSIWLGVFTALALSEVVKSLSFVSLEAAVYISASLFIGLGFLYLKKGNRLAAYFVFGWISNTLMLNYKFDKAGLEQSLQEITKSWANTPAWSWIVFICVVFLLVDKDFKLKNKK